MDRGSRAFIVENEKGENSLIDMTGEVLLPFMDIGYYSIDYNRDVTYAVCKEEYQKYKVYLFTHDDKADEPETPAEADENEGEPETQAAADGTWTCSNGHEGNTGNFCPECGEARPVVNNDVVCPSCGTVYLADQVPNFCPNDGTKLK